MPVGLLALAAAARRAFGEHVSFSVLDLTLGRTADVRDELRAALKRSSPDVVGFRGLSHQHEGIVELCRMVRQALPRAKVIVGGPHASMAPELLVREDCIDCVVRGEGEHTFVELLRAWMSGEDPTRVPGTVWQRDGKAVLAPKRTPIADLDSSPLPAYDLIDFDEYAAKPTMTSYLSQGRYANLFTSRGCPYRCCYCHSIFDKKVRFRSVSSLIEEVRLLADDHGVREFHVVDDIFNIDKQRVLEFAEQVLKLTHPIRLAFPNGLRADLIDADVVEAMRAAGTFFVRYALETASPRLQQAIGKNLRLAQAYDAIEMTAAAGIFVGVFNMLGFPDETEPEMLETVHRASQTSAIFSHYFQVTPYPGTKLYEQALHAGLLPEGSDLLTTLSFKHLGSASLARVPAARVVEIRQQAMREFSFSRKRVQLYRDAVPRLFSAAERAAYLRRKLHECEAVLVDVATPDTHTTLFEMLQAA